MALYRDPADKRVFVPKKGGGVALNFGHPVAWWIPLGVLIGVSVVLSYLTGIAAVRRLGASVASFVGLSEVLFAVLFAALLVGQRPGPLQLLGGVLVLGGIALVQRRSA